MTDAEIVIGIRGDIDGGKRVQRTLDDIDASGQRAQSGLAGLQQQANKTNGVLGGLGGALRSLGAAFGALELIRMSDQFTLLQERVKLATNGTAEFTEAFRGLQNASNQTGSSLSDAVDVFQRLSFVRTELNATVGEMVNFTGTVQKMGVMSGASTTAMSAGLLQLGQAMSAGVVRAEEFNSVMENLPAVAKTVADQFGITTGQLRQLILAGKVESADFFNAILNASIDVEEQYNKMPMTIGRAFAQLRNELQSFVGGVNESSSASIVLITGIDALKLAVYGLGKGFEVLTSMVEVAFISIIKTVENGINTVIAGANKVIQLGNSVTGGNSKLYEKLDLTGGATYTDLLKGAGSDLMGKLDTPTPSIITDKIFSSGETTKSSQATKELTKDYKALAGGLSETSKEGEAARKTLENVTSNLVFQNEQLGRNNLEQEIANNLRQAGVSINSAAGMNIAALTMAYDENSKALEQQKEIADGLSGAFDGFFKSAIQGSEGFKGAIKGLVGSLADMAFQMTVMEPIKNNLFGAASNIFGSLFSSAAGSYATASARGVANPKLYGPGFASGGSMVLGGAGGIDQNQLSLNGQPIARVGRGEVLAVSPNGGAGGRSVIVNQTINLSMGVAEAVAAQFSALMPQIEKATSAAVQEANMRGITT